MAMKTESVPKVAIIMHGRMSRDDHELFKFGVGINASVLHREWLLLLLKIEESYEIQLESRLNAYLNEHETVASCKSMYFEVIFDTKRSASVLSLLHTCRATSSLVHVIRTLKTKEDLRRDL